MMWTSDALPCSPSRDDPFPCFAELRAMGPVHRVTLASGTEAWLVVRYAEAKAALSDPRFSKDMHAAFARDGQVVDEGLPGRAFARHMLAVDPPDHTRLRGLVAPAFAPARVAALRPRVQALVDELLDGLTARPAGETIDLVPAYAFAIPYRVIAELLGLPRAQWESFAANLTALLTESDRAASDAVVATLGDLVAVKRVTPGDDLVSELIAARDGDDQLSEEELLSTIFQLIVAGHDTTASLIGNAVVAILRDGATVDTVIAEVLRHDPPVPHATFRYAVEAVDVGGVTIPAGAQVLISIASANADSTAPHLAFGSGAHFCLGAGLARMEGELAITSLCARFPELRLACAFDDLHWSHGDGLVLRGLAALPVRLR
jgi:cytochrome P450